MNALTTLKLTSASSSASRISRSAFSTCSGVSRTSPRSDLKTSWMRVLSDSNMGTYARAKPNGRKRLSYGRLYGLGKPLYRGELVAQLVLLGLQVLARRLRRGNLQRNCLGDRESVPLQADKFPRVVRQQPHGFDAEIRQDLRPDPIVALVGFEAEALVRLDRIEPLVLKLVRANLVREPDTASFLIEIEQDAATFLRNPRHRRIELCAAVAAG